VFKARRGACCPAAGITAARADRDYQIAAALFYSRQFDEAAARFTAIGERAVALADNRAVSAARVY
jgi:hypothetical protein